MRRLPGVLGVLLVAGLATTVLWLDWRQAARGTPSLLGLPWRAPATRLTDPGRVRRTAPGTGQIAVVVDELGGRLDVFAHVLQLGRPLAVAVLPELPLARRIAQGARQAGLELLVQLPLEPYRYPAVDPGPGVLLLAMTPETVLRRTRVYLEALPGAVGMMTHMGSRFTEDASRMRALLEAAQERGVFFIDGRPSQWSVGYDLARGLGVPAARRQVALDPEDAEAVVRTRLEEAAR